MVPSSSALSSSQSSGRHRPRAPNKALADQEQQWLYTEDELDRTPSIVDGMKPEEEKEIRAKGINFIGQVGVMLKLPQTTLVSAAVYFNRYLMRRSLKAKKDGPKVLHHYQIAAICVFLATKVEETCRKMKEIVIAVCKVAQKNPNLQVDEQTKDYWRWRDSILLNEDQLLEAIAFDLTFEQPHKFMFDMLQYYDLAHNKSLRNAAWSFINDSNFTQLCLLFTSRTIAAAALYCAAKHCDVMLPDDDGRPWWEVQHVKLRDIRKACNYMASMFETQPPKEGIENIYVGLRTPVEGSPEHAKTRLKMEQTPESVSMERSGSNQSLKRNRDEINGSYDDGFDGKMEVDEREYPNGQEDESREAKKMKREHAHNGNGSTKPDDDGSEEGEVEE